MEINGHFLKRPLNIISKKKKHIFWSKCIVFLWTISTEHYFLTPNKGVWKSYSLFRSLIDRNKKNIQNTKKTSFLYLPHCAPYLSLWKSYWKEYKFLLLRYLLEQNYLHVDGTRVPTYANKAPSKECQSIFNNPVNNNLYIVNTFQVCLLYLFSTFPFYIDTLL